MQDKLLNRNTWENGTTNQERTKQRPYSLVIGIIQPWPYMYGKKCYNKVDADLWFEGRTMASFCHLKEETKTTCSWGESRQPPLRCLVLVWRVCFVVLVGLVGMESCSWWEFRNSKWNGVHPSQYGTVTGFVPQMWQISGTQCIWRIRKFLRTRYHPSNVKLYVKLSTQQTASFIVR